MARRGNNNAGEDLPKTKITKDAVKKAFGIFKFIGPYKWKFALGMVFLILTGATALAFPWLMGELIKSGNISS